MNLKDLINLTHEQVKKAAEDELREEKIVKKTQNVSGVSSQGSLIGAVAGAGIGSILPYLTIKKGEHVHRGVLANDESLDDQGVPAKEGDDVAQIKESIYESITSLLVKNPLELEAEKSKQPYPIAGSPTSCAICGSGTNPMKLWECRTGSSPYSSLVPKGYERMWAHAECCAFALNYRGNGGSTKKAWGQYPTTGDLILLGGLLQKLALAEKTGGYYHDMGGYTSCAVCRRGTGITHPIVEIPFSPSGYCLNDSRILCVHEECMKRVYHYRDLDARLNSDIRHLEAAREEWQYAKGLEKEIEVIDKWGKTALVSQEEAKKNLLKIKELEEVQYAKEKMAKAAQEEQFKKLMEMQKNGLVSKASIYNELMDQMAGMLDGPAKPAKVGRESGGQSTPLPPPGKRRVLG
jgi:hypothetical protein